MGEEKFIKDIYLGQCSLCGKEIKIKYSQYLLIKSAIIFNRCKKLISIYCCNEDRPHLFTFEEIDKALLDTPLFPYARRTDKTLDKLQQSLF